MTAVYKGFRTRDVTPRILPGKAIPRPCKPSPTPPALKAPQRRAHESAPAGSQR